MPTVGARRSTRRVFVPKSRSGSGLPAGSRLLRSGKRLALSEPLKKQVDVEDERGDDDRWLSIMGGGGGGSDCRWRERNGCNGKVGVVAVAKVALSSGAMASSFTTAVPDDDAMEETSAELVDYWANSSSLRLESVRLPNRPPIVYSRKRRRPRTDAAEACSLPFPAFGSSVSPTNDRRFGIVFRRKPRLKAAIVATMPKSSHSAAHGESIVEALIQELTIPSSARVAAMNAGFLQDDILNRVDSKIVLGVIVEPLVPKGLFGFVSFLLSVCRSMRVFRRLPVLLWLSSIAESFSRNGVHFLPLQLKNTGQSPNQSPPCGFCKISGSKNYVPILQLNFAALPSFFLSLDAARFIRYVYIPAALRRSIVGIRQSSTSAIDADDYDSESSMEIESVMANGVESKISVSVGHIPSSFTEAHGPLVRDAGIMPGLRVTKHQKKRSSLRHFRHRQRPLTRLHTRSAFPKYGNIVGLSEARPTLRRAVSIRETFRLKPLEVSVDPLDNTEESDISTPIGSNGKQKKDALKSPIERFNEKQALAEVKRNIDSVRCKANILVIQADRCWREEGAEVMLQETENSGWLIAVKAQDTTRILHKPQELKPCVVNRFSHAYMFSVDEGNKLEFMDKWEWVLFKELYMECRDRNTQVKMIPIPGVTEVSDYKESTPGVFLRPEDYIRWTGDDVARALAVESVVYDMDNEDEEWLDQLNLQPSDIGGNRLRVVSPEDFERMVSVFEKYAYNTPDEIGDLDGILAWCQVQKDDTVVALHDYWVKKRSKKGGFLVRHFQGAPSKKPQVQPAHKPNIRRKRSKPLKRQRSQSGFGKPGTFMQAFGSADDVLRRVQEAEAAARRAVEIALRLRARAQMLMTNADLATYKAVMAVRIVELPAASSSDLVSSMLQQ